MLSRRHLFRTLSAIALAPLAKLVPKEGPTEFQWRRQTLIRKYPSEACAMFVPGREIDVSDKYIEVDERLIRVIPGPLQWPVTLEEA